MARCALVVLLLAACGGDDIDGAEIRSAAGFFELRGNHGDGVAAFDFDNPHSGALVEVEHQTSVARGSLRVQLEDPRGESALNESFLSPKDRAESRRASPGRWRIIVTLDRIDDPFLVRVTGIPPQL